MKLRLKWVCFAVAFVLVLSVYLISEVVPFYTGLPSFERLKLAGFPITFSAETAEKPLPPVEANGTPDLSLSVGELDFGQVRVGSRSKEFVVTVTNTGGAPLKISELQLPSPHFTVTRAPILPAKIGPGVRVKFNVAFEAASPGTALSNIAVVTNAPKDRVEIPVRAEAIGGEVLPAMQVAKASEKSSSEKPRMAQARTQVVRVSAWQTLRRVTKRSPWPRAARTTATQLASHKRSRARKSRQPRTINLATTQQIPPVMTRPVVKVTEPMSGGELRSVTTVRWTATHPTGDRLQFNVYFQNPSFRLPLATGVVENSVEVAIARIGMAEMTGQFVVQANDGRNIVEATSPEVTIRFDSDSIGDRLLHPQAPSEENRGASNQASVPVSRVRIISPSDSEAVSGMIAVLAELQEGLELDSISLRIDGQKQQAGVFQSGLKLEVPFDTKHLSDGLHQLSLELVEKTGRKSLSTVTVLVSNGTLSRRQ